jgi:ribonucleoside-diphosphate reductase alpha chain
LTINTIVKRDGTVEPFDPNKLNKWMEFAYQNDNEWADIALGAIKKVYDNCTTTELQQALIQTCLEKETNKAFKAAGRLYLPMILKNVFEGTGELSFSDHYLKMINDGLYYDFKLTADELLALNTVIDQNLDYTYSYTSLKQIVDKYILKDLITGKYYETPQQMYMRVAIYVANLSRHPSKDFISMVRSFYHTYSSMGGNLPSPNLVYLGTIIQTGASCCLVESDDTIDSLAAHDHAVYKMTVAGAGIGSHIRTRSLKDSVKRGSIKHQGKLPYYRQLSATVAANMQNSRGGAATTYFCALDPEIETIISLRNPKSIDSKRIPGIDYNIKLHPFIIEAVEQKISWMLISYMYAPDLYDAFDSDDLVLFRSLYFKYLNDETVPKKLIKPIALLSLIAKEPFETGRLYKSNMYEINHHTPFKEKIVMSNLCVEICLPTGAFISVLDLYRTDNVNTYRLILEDNSVIYMSADDIVQVNGKPIKIQDLEIGMTFE